MLTAPGVGSGLDIAGLVSQLVAAERQPVANRLNLQEAKANAELSAYGKLKSALATFQDSLEALSKLEKFQGRLTSTSDEEILKLTADETSVPGSYDIEVVSLASTHKLASAAFTDTTSAVGTGTLSITVNGQISAIAIVAGANSLLDIQDAINNATDNPGVRATIVNAADGAHLVINSKETGLDQEITIAVSGGDGGLAPLAFDPLSGTNPMSELDPAADALVKIDGFTVNSGSNKLTNIIQGITIDLVKAAPGATVSASVSLDEEGAKNSVGEFVTAYNSLMLTIGELTSFDPESGEAGTLLGDSAVRGIKGTLRRELSQSTSGLSAGFSTLTEIGITTKTDGNLELDADKLSAALAADFDDVGLLFADATDGLAIRLDAVLEQVLGGTGQIQNREQTLKDRLERVKDQREVLDLRMEKVQARLQAQFNAMDQLLVELTNTSNFLTRQLGNLT